MIVVLFVFTIFVSIFDITSAMLYAGKHSEDVLAAMVFVRYGFAAILAAYGMAFIFRQPRVAICAGLYVAFILAYAVAADDVLPPQIILSSSVKLAMPILLLLAGYGALRTDKALSLYALLLAVLACSSALFGIWDIQNTEFWTETVEYGHYLHDQKGIEMGYNERWLLPFNFFGYENERRAAGLVAAPLAQGMIMVVGGGAGIALFQRRQLAVALAILALCMIGVWQSGTRGAMLAGLIVLPFLLLKSGGGLGLIARNVAILGAILFVSYEALYFVYSYTASFDDGSTIGHVWALQENLSHLDEVVLLGKGIGHAGSVAADVGLSVAGGGEGALFSVIYQLGLPAGLAFLAFYGMAAFQALQRSRRAGAGGDVALLAVALAAGVGTSMVLSEHLFSLSATVGFWVLLGGAMAHSPARDQPVSGPA